MSLEAEVDQNRIDGWKAIASHIHRSVRQSQRLYKTSGLPVHRLPGVQSVFAFTEELDRWLAGLPEISGDSPGIQISRSGKHVTLPVELADLDMLEEQRTVAPETELRSDEAQPGRRRLFLAVALLLSTLTLLALGVHHRHNTGWRNAGTPLTGEWTFKGSGVVGRGQSVARFDTGRFVAPGTTTTVTLSSFGTRWSGGFEIFDDDLHWTFVALSPREHEIVVQRFPAGTVDTFFMGESIEPARPVELHLTIGASSLKMGCGRRKLQELQLNPWDVIRGRLVLRVGSPGDETHDPSGGTCWFRDLRVMGAPPNIPPPTARDVAAARRPSTSYILTVDNIDDQIDVLIDGRRLASAGYREEIGPLNIDPYLTRGQHTITALVFNRKWTASYGIRLTEDGTEIWHESCGSVTKAPYGCPQIGDRLGMVKRLSFTFTAR
ncbi:MAG: hypothetical protein GXP47_09315 [Acidobacteria bacterium]|nr:hypothetical protein [Acidobacteriota bacterium]